MVPLYILATKIYHFSASRLQFGQITDLEPIDSESDRWAPLVSADVAGTEGYLLTRTGSHMSEHFLKTLNSPTHSQTDHRRPPPPPATSPPPARPLHAAGHPPRRRDTPPGRRPTCHRRPSRAPPEPWPWRDHLPELRRRAAMAGSESSRRGDAREAGHTLPRPRPRGSSAQLPPYRRSTRGGRSSRS
jgi:hypothetical protein